MDHLYSTQRVVVTDSGPASLLMKELSATNVVELLGPLLKRTHWMLAFDRDGTLAPFTEDPEHSFVNELSVKGLSALAQMPNVTVAIVSARATAKLLSDFGHNNLIVAGNYGSEILFPHGLKWTDHESASRRPQLKRAKDALCLAIAPACNIILEDHGFSLCLHFHKTPKKYLSQVFNAVLKVGQQEKEIIIRRLETSFEFMPPGHCDKASALNTIQSLLPPLNKNDVFYLFAGDSDGDEPAFRWVVERGGVAFNVGPPRHCSAQYQLKSPDVAAEIIQELLAFRRATCPFNN
ncbi:MAG TPA: trehalose-phosphatase [Candidatus Obscuribacterales bacterium]